MGWLDDVVDAVGGIDEPGALEGEYEAAVAFSCF